MKKLSIALIGAGKMGKRWALIVGKNKNAALDWIISRTAQSTQSLAALVPHAQATTDWEMVLNDPKVHAVIIATPHRYLAPFSHQALMAGKHVLCEKPGALHSADIKKNALLAEKKGLTYMIAYNHRFHDAFIKARKFINTNAIGDIIFIRARYGFGGRMNYHKEWRLDQTISGGGHLIDQGVHMIDLVLSFIGKARVTGFTSDTFWKKGTEDNAFVLLQGRNKETASIHVSLTQWKPLHNFEIYGTKGYLSIEGLGMKYGMGEKLVIGKRSKNFSSEVKEELVICNSHADDSLALVLSEFIAAQRRKRTANPSPSDAYEVLKVVEKIYKENRL